MHVLRKTKTFSASHNLCGLPEGHQCTQKHGHSYRVDVVILATDELVEANGWVMDFGEISATVDELDHVDLNEVLGIGRPTAEYLAEWISGQLTAKLQSRCADLNLPSRDSFKVAVTVHEGPGACVTYYEGRDLSPVPSFCGMWGSI
jgi:6-pyruvoyltetrahydropterin/6-carboxytetrahydropterin synthase